jgi:hypothetical protein
MELFTEDTLFNWEERPAVVLKGGKGYAVVSEAGNWERVSAAEVVDSGRAISTSAFSKMFPQVDPNTIPATDKSAPSKV